MAEKGFKEHLEGLARAKAAGLMSHRELVATIKSITDTIGTSVNILYDLPYASIHFDLGTGRNEESWITVRVGWPRDDGHDCVQARPFEGFRTTSGGLVDAMDFEAVLVEAIERIQASFKKDVQRAHLAQTVADFLKKRASFADLKQASK